MSESEVETETDAEGDPIYRGGQVFNPNEYILSNENLVILGGTQSGKTNQVIYYLKMKRAQGNRSLMITAKPERKYREAFDVVTEDGEEAVELMLKPDPETKKLRAVLWEVDITEGDEVANVLDGISWYLKEGQEKDDKRTLTVAVDEYSLLVKNKQEGSDVNTSLQRAAATWQAYNGQLVVVAQRSSMIHHTVLTQSRLTLYRVPQGDLQALSKIVYPDLDEEVLRFLEGNPYCFCVVDAFDLNRFAPIPLQH